MAQRTSTTKLIGTNVGILLLCLWSVNLFFSIIIDGVHLFKQVFVPIEQKLYTESLPDQEEAQKVFRELRQLTKRYVPFMGWARYSFSGTRTTVNEIDGERVTPQSTTPSSKHIHFFGGSTMWGTGVDDHHTIPAQFAKLSPNSRVYNHAQSGFVSRQELARLINLVNQNNPMDVVIFYDGCNDPLTLCRGGISINGHREQTKIANKLTHRWQVPEDLLGSTKIALRTIFKPGKRPPSQCKSNPTYTKQVAQTLVNNWKIARNFAALGGADFHAILQPVARLGEPRIDYLDEKFDGTEWNLVYPLVREIKEQEGLTWIHDFTDAFNTPEPLYIDLCHVNGQGNEIIAKKIIKLLEGARPSPNST